MNFSLPYSYLIEAPGSVSTLPVLIELGQALGQGHGELPTIKKFGSLYVILTVTELAPPPVIVLQGITVLVLSRQVIVTLL